MPDAPLPDDPVALLPHRPPFRFVDAVDELIPGQLAVARWRITGDEAFLAGHFPGRPIMPGVLMVEALAQAGCVGVLSHEDFAGRLAVFAGLEGVRFRRLVTPGDTLELELVVDKLRRAIGRGSGTVRVGDEIAVEAQLIFGFIDG